MKKNKKMVVRQGRLRGLLWAKSATARYPSTVGSGQLSLLCEESGAGRTEEGGVQVSHHLKSHPDDGAGVAAASAIAAPGG